MLKEPSASRHIYLCCVAVPDSHASELYNQTRSCILYHVENVQKNLMSIPEEIFLEQYCLMWLNYDKAASNLHNLFGYMNRQYVVVNRQNHGGENCEKRNLIDVKEVGHMAMDIWLCRLIEPLKDLLIAKILDAIRIDRTNKSPNPSPAVKAAIHSLIKVDDFNECRIGGKSTLPTYKKYFKETFMEATKEFYGELSKQMIAELTISQYMEEMTRMIDLEVNRIKSFLCESSIEETLQLCRTMIVEDNLDKFLAVCADLIKNEQKMDLHNMYMLIRPLKDGFAKLTGEFERLVRKNGIELMKTIVVGENVPHQFFHCAVDVYHRYHSLVANIFHNDSEFLNALDKALHYIVNNHPIKENLKPCEVLVSFIDTYYRKGAADDSEEEREKILDDCILLFKYIDDKDLFEKFYTKLLANRLIFNIPFNKETENLFVGKLKKNCGYEFTGKINRMYLDIDSSMILTKDFHKHINSSEQDLPFSVLVLQSGAWLLSKDVEIGAQKDLLAGASSSSTVFSPLSSMASSLNEFEMFYMQKHSGKKLQWMYNFSTADVQLNYTDKPYLVTMSVYQVSILMAFLNSDTVKLSDVMNLISLKGDSLLKNVRALIDSNLLLCDNKEELNEESMISLNLSFTNKRKKLKIILLPSQRQAGKMKEQEVNHNMLEMDRKCFIECIVVRIMKTRKVVKHASLIQEIMSESKKRFVPEVPFIKRCIEGLIDKAYLQRTDQPDEYQYLA